MSLQRRKYRLVVAILLFLLPLAQRGFAGDGFRKTVDSKQDFFGTAVPSCGGVDRGAVESADCVVWGK